MLEIFKKFHIEFQNVLMHSFIVTPVFMTYDNILKIISIYLNCQVVLKFLITLSQKPEVESHQSDWSSVRRV